MLVKTDGYFSASRSFLGLPLEPAQNPRSVLVGVLVGNTLLEGFHIGDCRDSGFDQSMVRCLEALLGREIVILGVMNECIDT